MTPEVREQLQKVIDTVAPQLRPCAAGHRRRHLRRGAVHRVAGRRRAGGGHARAHLADRRLRHHQGAGHHSRAGARCSCWSTRPRKPGEGRTVRAQLQQVLDRYVAPGLNASVRLDLLGEVPADAAVREAVQRRQLLLEAMPGAWRPGHGGRGHPAAGRQALIREPRWTSDRRRRTPVRPHALRAPGWRGGRARTGRPLLRPDGPGAGVHRHPRAAPVHAGRLARQAVLVPVRLAGRAQPLHRALRPPAAARAAPALCHRPGRARPVAGLHGAGHAGAGGRPGAGRRLAESFFGTADWMRNKGS
jgi:hypothetical protein